MPLLGRKADARRRVAPRWDGMLERKRIEAATTPTAKDDFLRDLVLDTEKELMKLNEDFIVRHKAIDRKQTIAKSRNKKNIFKFNGRR